MTTLCILSPYIQYIIACKLVALNFQDKQLLVNYTE